MAFTFSMREIRTPASPPVWMSQRVKVALECVMPRTTRRLFEQVAQGANMPNPKRV